MDHEVTLRNQFGTFLPGVEFVKLVGAHDQVQLGGRAHRFLKVAYRIDRVGSAGAADFRVRHHEMAIALGGQPDHAEPLLSERQIALLLMGRGGGRDEVEQIETQDLTILFGGAQMTEMDRVETTPVESDAHNVSR